MKHLLVILCATFIFIGCSTNNPSGAAARLNPDLGKSEFLHTTGGGFALQVDENQKPESCHYSLLLVPSKSLGNPLYLRAQFENPLGGAPLTTDAVLQPTDKDVLLTSPPVRGLRTARVYRVDVLIYSDAGRTQPISSHTQHIKSYINF